MKKSNFLNKLKQKEALKLVEPSEEISKSTQNELKEAYKKRKKASLELLKEWENASTEVDLENE